MRDRVGDHRRRTLAGAGPAGAEPDPGDHRRPGRGWRSWSPTATGPCGGPACRRSWCGRSWRLAWRGRTPAAAASRCRRRPARLIPGSSPVVATRLTRWARSTEASCRVWPWVNSRSSWPSVAGAYTPPNNRRMPPERITSRSSMQSAPAAIPAMIAVSFPAGFAPAEATLDVLNRTRCRRSAPPSRSARPTPSPGPSRRTTPDARHRRPGPPATSHQVVSLPVPSAAWFGSGTRHSRFSKHRRHINVQTRRDRRYRSTDRG